jgi:magnesium transporter
MSVSEKYSSEDKPRFVSPRLTIRLLFCRAQRFVGDIWKSYWEKPKPSPSATQLTLRRMARTRKLVTVLGRLLGTKSDVVTQIRKRLTRSAHAGHTSEELEVAIYMGDVQDHILTLQNALTHYERMLSQSHPTYLAQLRSMLEQTKGRADTHLLYLTIVSISILCLQPLTGLSSMNVTVPTDPHEPGGSYIVFGIILVMIAIVIVIFLFVVRYWWEKAKQRRGRRAPL